MRSGFFGVGELFGINGGRVVLAHADNAGAGGLTVYIEDVTGGCLDIGMGERLRDGCGAVGAQFFFRGDFLLRGLRSGVCLVVVYCFEEGTVRG